MKTLQQPLHESTVGQIKSAADTIRDLYKPLVKGMDKSAIASLSIPFLCALYIILFKSPSLSHPLYEVLPFLFPALGTIFGSDFEKSPRIALLARSSTDDGDHGASRSHQLDVLKKSVDSFDGTVSEVESIVESAKTMDRESLDELLELAENDEIDAIGVMDIDRLTRAPVFEAVNFYQKMKESGCLLYATSIGFVDWDDLNDIQPLLNQTVFARKWFLRIKEGSAGSIISDLEDGKYPRGKTPIGFETDDEHNIWIVEDEREFMYRVFQTYVRVQNRAEMRRKMNKWRREQGMEELSDSRYKTLLQSPLCIGHLRFKDQLVSVKPELRVVDEETFHRAQEILRERRPSDEGEQDLPEYIARAADRYGLDYIMSILESFEPRCRECGDGVLRPNGSTELNGVPLRKYRCQECNYQGPLLKPTEVNEIHQTLPLRCPFCPTTEWFDVEKIEGFDEYRYTCKVCDHSFKHSTPPNKIERAFNSPNEKFDMDEPYAERRDNADSSSTTGPSVDDKGPEEQTALSSF